MRKFSIFLTSSTGVLALLLSGCGGNSAAPPATPKVKHPVALAATPTQLPAQSTPYVAPTITPSPRPSATAGAEQTATAIITNTPRPVSGPPSLLSASVNPSAPAAGGLINVTVHTQGPVGRVTLYLGSGSPTGPAPVSYVLTPSLPGTWVGGGRVPAVAGQYHYSVGLFAPSGRRIIVDRDAWNIAVSGGNAPTAVPANLSFPDDIPLSPPFSYGSPQTAVFSAGGQTVNGAEVVSNTRTDVSASTVAQWYEVHFPRAGWTVTSGVPAAGATSFSIQATKGKRVCIAQYAGSTVHLFYGTLS